MSRQTEVVKARDIETGDEVLDKGTVERVLNDSGILTFDTDTTCFARDMNDWVIRYVKPDHTCEGYVAP